MSCAAIEKNAWAGQRTLFVCFYAGHGANDTEKGTVALLNSTKRGEIQGGNQFNIEAYLQGCSNEKGGYVVGLLACDRANLKECEESMIKRTNKGKKGYDIRRVNSVENTIEHIKRGTLVEDNAEQIKEGITVDNRFDFVSSSEDCQLTDEDMGTINFRPNV